MAGTVSPYPVWPIYLSTDNLLRLTALTDEILGTTVDAAATVEVTLRDSDGVDVVGATWPLAFTAEGTGGNYYVILPDAVTITEDALYEAEIVVDDGPNRKGTWYVDLKAQKQQ
jgi:hypothetical protein